MELRPYQREGNAEIHAAWNNGAANVCYSLATGGGKTVTFSHILQQHEGASCAIAHRQELVSQMSLTLARHGVYHRIIAPTEVIRDCVTLHMREVGRSYYDSNARCGVAGVDTLLRRDLGDWGKRVSLWVCDEGHHLQRDNKWGKALGGFNGARGLAVTATPCRADGRGLSRMTDGILDHLVLGPSMRDLIEVGYLTDYRVYAPRTADFDVEHLAVSDATGDYSAPAMREAAKRSHITGDVVDSYLRIAPGKLGVTFAVSVELAVAAAARYRAAGVPAECVSADTPTLVRAEILRRFRKRELLQLVNVDLFGEGFDLPAIEVVSMARPTQSYGLYAQQFGRAIRPMEGKPHALIIDHVGNILRHGLPDAPRIWSLGRRERRGRSSGEEGVTAIRACPACTGVYERWKRRCPYCGHVPEPASRAAPEHVDGDLHEIDPLVLARMRRAADAVGDAPRIPYGASAVVAASIRARHREAVAAQGFLRQEIAWWAGYQRAAGLDDPEAYRRFYLTFGVDVLSAQTLGTKEAQALTARVAATLPAVRGMAA